MATAKCIFNEGGKCGAAYTECGWRSAEGKCEMPTERPLPVSRGCCVGCPLCVNGSPGPKCWEHNILSVGEGPDGG
jgi:hypothetical protein